LWKPCEYEVSLKPSEVKEYFLGAKMEQNFLKHLFPENKIYTRLQKKR
jgi:hypothetical protein